MGIFTVKRILLEFLDTYFINEIASQESTHGLSLNYIIRPDSITEYFLDKYSHSHVSIELSNMIPEYTRGNLNEVACDFTEYHTILLKFRIIYADKQRCIDTLDVWSDSIIKIIKEHSDMDRKVNQTLIRGINFSNLIDADENKRFRKECTVNLLIKERED